MRRNSNVSTSTVRPRDSKPEKWLAAAGVTLRPIHDVVYAERFEIADEICGITIPDMYKGNAVVGRVFAVGPGLPVAKCVHDDGPCHLPMDVKVGDYVLFGALGVRELQFEVGGRALEYVALIEGEILGKVEYD